MKRIIENTQYIVLILLIIAQCVIGSWFLLGQGLYLIANLISVARSFCLKRPPLIKLKIVLV
jgi:hypothetical protein